MIGIVVKAAVGLLAVGAVGTAVVVAVSPADAAADQAVVTRLVDGDTFDASIDGRTERIRMLNIDTPETKDPDEAVQCLGPEASAFLASLIPVGTRVTLEYDNERTDGYGRTLAGVFMANGTLINAEIARAGLGTAVVFGENDRFYQPVKDAQQEASAQAQGLYSPQVDCTLPTRVDAVSDALAQAPTAATQPGTASAAQLDTAAVDVAAVAGTAAALVNTFGGDRRGLIFAAFTRDEQEHFATRVTGTRETAQREETALRTAAGSARVREDEAAEAARVANEERRSAEAEARTKPQRQPPNPPASGLTPRQAPDRPPAAAPDANPYPGYTGPRCYAPGGKTWKPC